MKEHREFDTVEVPDVPYVSMFDKGPPRLKPSKPRCPPYVYGPHEAKPSTIQLVTTIAVVLCLLGTIAAIVIVVANVD